MELLLAGIIGAIVGGVVSITALTILAVTTQKRRSPVDELQKAEERYKQAEADLLRKLNIDLTNN